MKILIISPKNKTVFNFRGDLIKDMIAQGNEVCVTGPNGDFVDDIMALGVKEFIEVPFVKDNTSVKGDIAYYLRLLKVMKEKRPDMVFSYTIKPVVYGSMAAKRAKIKHIYAMVTGLGRVYTSNSLKTKLVRVITKLLYSRAFKGCDKVFFQNGDDINELVEQNYLPRDKAVLVSGSGVNMERFRRTPLPETTSFLMVGRIIKEKGVIEFCEAARQVKKNHPEAVFTLLGGFDSSIGALRESDIKPYIEENSIVFPGEVKDPTEFYAGSSVFVLPSFYREGLPRTILEALSCGRPVITTDWPGCREAITDGENGFLVEPKNVRQLAEKMTALIEDKKKLLEMSDAAFMSCKNNYSVEIINAQMRAVMKY